MRQCCFNFLSSNFPEWRFRKCIADSTSTDPVRVAKIRIYSLNRCSSSSPPSSDGPIKNSRTRSNVSKTNKLTLMLNCPLLKFSNYVIPVRSWRAQCEEARLFPTQYSDPPGGQLIFLPGQPPHLSHLARTFLPLPYPSFTPPLPFSMTLPFQANSLFRPVHAPAPSPLIAWFGH